MDTTDSADVRWQSQRLGRRRSPATARRNREAKQSSSHDAALDQHRRSKGDNRKMKRIKTVGLALVALVAFGVMTAAAQAEGPFYKKTGSVRLGAGETFAVSGEASKAFTLVASTDTLICEKLSLEKGELIGSATGTAGSSKEIILFSGCTVSGNGTGCEVEKGQIKTEEVENWLDKTNKTGTEKEHLLVGFKPASGAVFVKVKFTAPKGDKCTLSETAIEIGKTGELGVAGVAQDEAGNPIELEVTSTEKLGKFGFIEFPATLLKAEFVEKGTKVEEVKESLKAFGKAVTKFEGTAKVSAVSGEYGVFGH
jgi:hypothetical protein